jgi:hypothetical protein
MGLVWTTIHEGKTRAFIDGPHEKELWNLWRECKAPLKEDGVSIKKYGERWMVTIKNPAAESVCEKWRRILIG